MPDATKIGHAGRAVVDHEAPVETAQRGRAGVTGGEYIHPGFGEAAFDPRGICRIIQRTYVEAPAGEGVRVAMNHADERIGHAVARHHRQPGELRENLRMACGSGLEPGVDEVGTIDHLLGHDLG